MGSASSPYDVVVAGFGGAGACAAIEAHDRGARVLLVDRFDGGGATRLSGGVVYAGGGTAIQRAAQVEDSPEAMLAYLREETSGAVSDEALARFCAESPAQIAWLEGLGVGFEARVYEPKTTQPPDGYGLYYSGNERQYARVAAPAPRGHVPRGRGMTGHVLYAALERAVRDRGVEVRLGARVVGLHREGAAVAGLELLAIPASSATRRAHAALARAALLGESGRRALDAFERRLGRREIVRARAVILATGGFVFAPEMMRRYAPAYAGSMPLGTAGDDGSGIALGVAAGADVRHMERCAASRFFAPPEAFVSGVLVDARGERICDETLYGATLSAKIAERGGRAFLIIDASLAELASRQMRDEERLLARPLAEVLGGEVNHLIFRKWCALVNGSVNRVRGATLAELGRACGLPEGALERTIGAYNDAAARGAEDAMRKSPSARVPLARPPFYAIRCDLDSRLFPGPCITLGGLAVDEATGAVLDSAGAPLAGLFAAGRAAAGVASRSYVSGLSLADCIHSGRRAGRAAAARARA